jgi:DNA-binding transcriptional ArsR family regulator
MSTKRARTAARLVRAVLCVRPEARELPQPFAGMRFLEKRKSGACQYKLRVDGEPPIAELLLVRVAERLRVLGQPVRLRLIEQLTAGPSTPMELSEVIGTSQQNVSKHLLALYRAGVVTRRPEGRTSTTRSPTRRLARSSTRCSPASSSSCASSPTSRPNPPKKKPEARGPRQHDPCHRSDVAVCRRPRVELHEHRRNSCRPRGVAESEAVAATFQPRGHALMGVGRPGEGSQSLSLGGLPRDHSADLRRLHTAAIYQEIAVCWGFLRCRRRDSNPRHADYDSAALTD